MQYRIETSHNADGVLTVERPVWCENRYTAVAEYRHAVSDAIQASGDALEHAARQVILCDAEQAISAEYLTVEVADYRVTFNVYH